MRKTQQTLEYAVFLPGHPAYLGLKRIQRLSKCDKHQTFAALVGLLHGPANHKGLRLATYLCGSFDMGRNRRVIKFFVVAQTPADKVVLLGLRQLFERIKIMDPLLVRDKAGTTNSRPCVFDDGRIDGAAFRFPGAVFSSRKIAPAIEFKPVDETIAAKSGLQRFRD